MQRINTIDTYLYVCPHCGKIYNISLTLGKQIPLVVRCECGYYALFSGKEVLTLNRKLVSYKVVDSDYLAVSL